MLHRFCILILILNSISIKSQYTDQINSNRPGASIGAYAVGKNVIQFESGVEYRSYKHSGYNSSTFNSGNAFLSVRWGFLFEQLELTYEGVYGFGSLNSKVTSPNYKYYLNGMLQNFVGLKFLVFDPFKKERKVNVYSWKANNGFKIRELLPAISITVGPNINFEKENPFPYGNIFSKLYKPIFFQNIGDKVDEEPFFHLRGTIATQSHFLRTWVLVTNFSYNRYLSDYAERSYVLSLTHNFRPSWSIYIENEGSYSDLYRMTIFRTGVAFLFSNNLHFETSLGMNIKESPSLVFANFGASYRLDFHKDYESSAEIEDKKLKKEEKELKKTLKKTSRAEKKRNKKARKKN